MWSGTCSEALRTSVNEMSSRKPTNVEKVNTMQKKGTFSLQTISKIAHLNIDGRNKLASNPDTDLEVLRALSMDRVDSVRYCVARNPNTPSDILIRMFKKAKYKCGYIELEVLKNPNMPAKELERIAKHHHGFWYPIASNPKVPVRLLRKFLKGRNDNIRYDIAKNPGTPASILEQLSDVGSYEIRREVARNPNTPIKVLAWLSVDDNVWVRCGVAYNEATPIEMIKKLASDKAYEVRRAIAHNRNTPDDVLDRLSYDIEVDVLKEVAKNPNTPVRTLRKLFRNSLPAVRISVAENPNSVKLVGGKVQRSEAETPSKV